MKRATAMSNIRRLIDNCERLNLVPDEPIALETHVFGDLLDPDATNVNLVHAAIVLNHSGRDMPWFALPPEFHGLVYMFELEKVPVRAEWRPRDWPVCNHLIKRPVRVWTHDSGTDEPALEAIASGSADRFRLAEPSPEEANAQRDIEREASLDFLRNVVDNYYEPGWRRDHKGFGIYPETHLWHAAQGYLDLL